MDNANVMHWGVGCRCICGLTGVVLGSHLPVHAVCCVVFQGLMNFGITPNLSYITTAWMRGAVWDKTSTHGEINSYLSYKHHTFHSHCLLTPNKTQLAELILVSAVPSAPGPENTTQGNTK